MVTDKDKVLLKPYIPSVRKLLATTVRLLLSNYLLSNTNMVFGSLERLFVLRMVICPVVGRQLFWQSQEKYLPPCPSDSISETSDCQISSSPVSEPFSESEIAMQFQ